MRKKIIYILWAIVLSIGVGVLAQTTFDLEELFFTTTGIETWDYAGLHFNFSGNNFAGMVFFGTGIDLYNQQILELSWTTISCQKQINWFYINPARWNRIWPLDEWTLNTLQNSNTIEWYDDLELSGWFFTDCTGGSVTNTWEIYWYIKHTYSGDVYKLYAGINFDFPSWNPIPEFSGTLNYIDVPNYTASWYLYDELWWTARVVSTMWLFARAEFGSGVETGNDPALVTGWYDIIVDLFSNKNATYTITWDIESSPVIWTLTGGITKFVEVTLSAWVEGEKNIFVHIEETTEDYTKNLTLEIEDTENPTVTLISPNNWNTISNNNATLKRTWNDNFGISHYSLYLSGPGYTFYTWMIENTTITVWPLFNWTYERYVEATDLANNTGQSETRTFTISWTALWPILVSPEAWAEVTIGELNLLREPVYWANSWYERQISNHHAFLINNIIASGHTNYTGVWPIIHTPIFMTWTFYWRVIDSETAWVSEKRAVTIIDWINGTDTQVDQFQFNTITWAELSQVYSSNNIQITWLTNNVSVLAKLENNIGALFVNNIMVWNQALVKNGDTIKIELISKNAYNSLASTKLIVWEWSNAISGHYSVYTKNGTGILNDSWWNLPYALRIQAILFIDSLSEIYKHNPEKFATFLTTFKAILKDKSDTLANSITQTSNEQEKAFMNVQKLSIDYLMFVVTEYLNNMDYNDISIYIAPNGKQYIVQFDDDRLAYTSPNFMYEKRFPTRELFKKHIDVNNPWNYHAWTWDTITAPNGKTYVIYMENSKRTSKSFTYKKYFDTRDQIIEHININNPPTTWDHNIDTNFTPITHTAPNGRTYTIFKTASTWNNSNKYSSFMFLAPKYFSSLESAKNHIDSQNRK